MSIVNDPEQFMQQIRKKWLVGGGWAFEAREQARLVQDYTFQEKQAYWVKIEPSVRFRAGRVLEDQGSQ